MTADTVTPDTGSASGAEVERRVQRSALMVLAAILLTLAWYVAADRLTPYTDQARIEGFVVGVAPKVSGSVMEVYVSNNQTVEEGQSLFRVDAADYQIALDRARSELDKARSQVSAGEAGVTAARAGLDAALANEVKSRKDYERLQRLFDQDPGTISQRRLEMSEASLEAAVAQVAARRADIERAIESKGGTDDSNNAFLRAAESAVAKAELDLSNTIVRAARRGVITDLRTEIGQFAGAGKPLMTLVATHELWVNAAFTENNLGHITSGTPVEILFDVLPGQVFTGQISSVGLGVAAGKPPQPGSLPSVDNSRDWLRQSQRFPVQVSIDMPEDATLLGALRMGGQASVMAYPDPPAPLKWLGQLSLRVRSVLSYAY